MNKKFSDQKHKFDKIITLCALMCEGKENDKNENCSSIYCITPCHRGTPSFILFFEP